MSYPKTSLNDPADRENLENKNKQQVVASPSFPKIEKQVLDFWQQDDTFKESIRQRQGEKEWVFNDGPPFANGLPHYGHLLTGYAKDVFPRYQTMRGKKVERRFGWDTHGLPAELEVMNQLGITEKHEIEDMGIALFNEKAKESVLRYTKEWEEYVTRQARWVDFKNDYKTLNLDYMESVIWAFKELYNKGLAYEGQRILPYCWRDETPLSNHELRMDDDVYQMRQDPSVTVTFPFRGEKAQQLSLNGVRALAWTTTPWTLPTNAALAVGPEIEYAIIPAGPLGAGDGGNTAEVKYLLATSLLDNNYKALGYETAEHAKDNISAQILGKQLQGIEYEPLFDYFKDSKVWGTQNYWQILVDDYVTVTDGTGIVHQSPAYGEDDLRLTSAADMPTIISLDDGGKFISAVSDVAGMLWFEANRPIIRMLIANKRLLKEQSYEHSYPHCWRCRNPLIYKAVSSWFVKVTEIKDQLLQTNEEITWVPENVKHGQFGKWLEGARDWSISRNRYWGSPIPVWKSDNPDFPRIDVYGSLAEIETDFGTLPRNEKGEVDLHRPFIDELTRPNPDDPSGKSTMRRIEDVLDVWFDSGSMPFAQVHYPFENQKWFNEKQPADFIVEYIGQTRGWFYVQHVLATALFGRPAFKNVISHGIVLGSDGNKMSKSLQNYPDVNEVFERDGSDAMRWFLMSSPVIRGGNLIVTEAGIRESVRQFILPIWSTWYFFTLYANADSVEGVWDTSSSDPLDRYILAKTRTLIADVEHSLDLLDTTTATLHLRDFAEILTNWYVRRSRERFWEGPKVNAKNQQAFNTLFTVLETVLRVAAPLTPLISEKIWKGLTGKRSVHLSDWPDLNSFPESNELVETMDLIRLTTGSAQALRKVNGLRVRLPLNSLTLALSNPRSLEPFVDILKEEINVKKVFLEELTDESAQNLGVVQTLTINARKAGPRLGKDIQQVIKAAKSGQWELRDEKVFVADTEMLAGEYELSLTVDKAVATEKAISLLDGGGFVILDTKLTSELAAEGVARDAVRAIQDARKKANLNVSDRISLSLAAAEEDLQALSLYSELISAETLAVEIEFLSELNTSEDVIERSKVKALGTSKNMLEISINRVVSGKESDSDKL